MGYRVKRNNQVETISRKLYKITKVMTNNPIGSSETTRESPKFNFNFDDYIKNHQPQHKQINDKGENQNDYLTKLRSKQVFLEWFTGFTEGDGYFGYRMNGNQKRLQFALGQSDEPVLQYVRTELGFGKVGVDYSAAKSFRYVVEDQEGIRRIMSILNGNLVLPKRRAQFARWVEAGKRFLDPKFCLSQKVVILSDKTAWLSGFIEAEGCFYAAFTTPSQRAKISQRLTQKFSVTQQDTMGESDVLLFIGHLFGWNGKLSMVKKKTNCVRVEMSSLEQHIRIRNYISLFSLKGKKNIAFHRWCRVLGARIEKKHSIEAALPKLKQLCKEINKQTITQITQKTQDKKLFENSIPISEFTE